MQTITDTVSIVGIKLYNTDESHPKKSKSFYNRLLKVLINSALYLFDKKIHSIQAKYERHA